MSIPTSSTMVQTAASVPIIAPTRIETVPVVVELHSDGFVRVYGDKCVSAIVLNRPAVRSARAAIIAEQLIDECLPIRHRDVYCPGRVRATGQVRRITVDDIHAAILELRALEAVADQRPTPIRHLIARVLGVAR